MKKMLYVLIMLIFVGMLTATESGRSRVVGYVKYPCYVGLNFIVLPMDSGYTMVSDFANDFPGMMEAINYWDEPTQSWVSAIDLGYWEGDFAIQPFYIVMLNALTDFDVISAGYLPPWVPYRFEFQLGLNDFTLGAPLNAPVDISAWVTAADIGNAAAEYLGGPAFDAISYFDNHPESKSWVSAIDIGYWEGDFPLDWAKPALQVNVLAPFTW